MTERSRCALAGVCSGCPWLGSGYQDQLERKRERLAGLLRDQGLVPPGEGIEMVSAGEDGLRDRVDLSWQRRAGKLSLGLYHADRSAIVDIERCPQLSPALEAWLGEFRAAEPPLLEKGSVRLRVSPAGERGAWLDLANADVKALLDERSWLIQLASRARIEIGQRFKPLVVGEERLALAREPAPAPWFETYVGAELSPRPLFSAIGSFTQAGFRANRALVARLLDFLGQGPRGAALELFSGLGNFTLPLAAHGFEVTCFEADPVAVASFERTLEASPELAPRIRAVRADLYARGTLPPFHREQTLVVDPPRSGLRTVLDALEAAAPDARPARVVYVSCFAESLAADLGRLARLSYRLTRLAGVDQFAQSPHCEWIALLEIQRN